MSPSGLAKGSSVRQQHGEVQERADHRGPGPSAAGVHRRFCLHVGGSETVLHNTHPPGLPQRSHSKSSLSQNQPVDVFHEAGCDRVSAAHSEGQVAAV